MYPTGCTSDAILEVEEDPRQPAIWGKHRGKFWGNGALNKVGQEERTKQMWEPDRGPESPGENKEDGRASLPLHQIMDIASTNSALAPAPAKLVF